MKPDAMDILRGVEAFLLGAVSDQISVALRSDVRAAAKSLANAQAELDILFPLLLAECEALRAALNTGLRGLGRPEVAADEYAPGSLSELGCRHAALLDEAGNLIGDLQQHTGERARKALDALYLLLREQGRQRTSWQSVFPADRLISEVLIGAASEKG